MSAPQPSRQPSRRAPAAIKRAKEDPTVANAVSAIEAMHDDMVSEFQVLKGDVGKLLHHFGLVSGDQPLGRLRMRTINPTQ